MEPISYILGIVALVALVWALLERKDKFIFMDYYTTADRDYLKQVDDTQKYMNKVSTLERANKELLAKYNQDISNINKEKTDLILEKEQLQDNLSNFEQVNENNKNTFFKVVSERDECIKSNKHLEEVVKVRDKTIEENKRLLNANQTTIKELNHKVDDAHSLNHTNDKLIKNQDALIKTLKDENTVLEAEIKELKNVPSKPQGQNTYVDAGGKIRKKR